jgi:hypothetical protein
MNRFFRSAVPILAATVASILCSCYKPAPFVLGQPHKSPYQFPSSSTIASFLGRSNTNFKIAYALTGNGAAKIYYVDFNDSAPVPKALVKPSADSTIPADKPLISPDSAGGFVAYDLLAPNNDIYGAYIQKLDTAAPPILISAQGTRPHWYKDSAGLYYIIYSTAFFIPTTTMPAPGFAATYKQQVSLVGNGSLVGSPVQVAPYPMIGGLSSDGSYLCSGYAAGCFYNLPTASLISINPGVQICNPSIDPAPDSSNMMMFLNFGAEQALTDKFLPDSAYPANSQGVLPMHSVLFIVDATNTVINFIPISIMGSGYAAWQCPQWSNKSNFAVALASSSDDNASWDMVLLKNVGIRGSEQSLLMTVGSGKLNTESTPSLWIGN